MMPVHIEQDDAHYGFYLMEFDKEYVSRSCFHIQIYWIFARGHSLKQNVVHRLTTRIK
jgi:hypothetical protein